MAGLEGQLRQMARTLPESHDEIAAVAEAAGQLGVETGDVAGFTEVMVKLGETTNLTADQAATEIAQISNVMGTMARDGVDGAARFGSALVALGNNGASTEADILSMASRIAGAAKVVGMTEGDLLGVSNALASVGIEAEAGGTALSNVLIDMSKAVATGSDDLQGFADVAKMSADGFSTAFKDRPAAAVAAFTRGLARIQASGGDVFTTLSDLGQSDVRVTSALLKMAGAGTLFSDSLDLGAKAITNTNALNAEFAKRLDTTASKIQIARNNVRDAAITIGTSLAPPP
jgi:TP901 family phage tail tape measure protein